MSDTAGPLGFAIGDVAGVVRSNHAAFRQYARQHLGPIVCAPGGDSPCIRSELRWHERPPVGRETLVPDLGVYERPDRDLYVAGDRLAWFRIDDFRDLHLQVRWDGTSLAVEGDYHFFLNRSAWRDRLRRLWEARGLQARRRKRYATLLYYLIYYPAMWWHEIQRGAHPLHAAGVLGERGALVLAGPSGVGKSTLTVALTAAGGVPLAETFLLHRGTTMIAMPEPVLLDDWSRAWLDDATRGLSQVPGQFVFGRSGFHLDEPVAQAEAAAIIVPRRATPAGIAPITANEAQRRISGGHALIKDMRRYWAFAAALEKLAPEATTAGLMAAREAALARLTETLPCWELRLGPELTCAAATDLLAEVAQRSGAGGLAHPFPS